jgi:tetratricopeptide (TPR) repeat protein
MSDGAFPDRVTLLRSRWEADPSSRVFLQLAEEYRHQGRVKEALEVLDRGLKEHPGYLSALVAKGRCHLELGEPEPARTVLERVVKQDATQMVANKLLVRAYLETSEPDRARERLDLYSLLNDSDPEIEELRRRLRAMEQPPQAEKPGSTPPSDHLSSEAPVLEPPRRETAPPRSASDDIFDLTYSPRATAAVSPEEPFANLVAPPLAARALEPSFAPAVVEGVAPPEEEPAPPIAAWAPQPSFAPAAAAEVVTPKEELEAQEEAEPADILFPGLASRESRQRYFTSLTAEGLFLLDLTAEEPAVEARMQEPFGKPIPARAAGFEPASPVVEEPAPISVVEEPWSPEPLAEAAWPEESVAPPPMEEAAVLAEEEQNLWAPPPPFVPDLPAPIRPEVLAPAVAEPAATATLGELYRRQGHLTEAERIFREVLHREPDNATAQEGLAQVAVRPAERRPIEARDLLAGYEPGSASGEAEMKARKRWVLSGYLKSLRRGGQRDVS